METFLQITYLNDFVFCPYSIYLHQVFDNSNEELFTALPQHKGKFAHEEIDEFKTCEQQSAKVLKGSYVISNRFGIYGKIDKYYVTEKKLVESKFQIKTIYKGYYYQLWAQYFALTEMGYEVNELAFYSIKECCYFPVNIPGDAEAIELRNHISTIARFDFESDIKINPEKCKHCIYASLCDKTQYDHVYA